MSAPDDVLLAVLRWVEKAENDLRNAVHTLTLDDDCPFDTVCFHSQQCTEKYLKALLLSLGQEIPRVHDLRILHQLISANVHFPLPLADLLSLNRYGVETRYPGEWEPISRAEAEQAVAIAHEVRLAARRLLKLEERS